MAFLRKELAAAIALPLLLIGCGGTASEAEKPATADKNAVVFNKIADSMPQSGMHVVVIPPEKVPELKRTEPLVCIYGYEAVYRGGGPTLDCNF